MAESHTSYMHRAFPPARNNDHTPHLKHMHSTSHHDGMLRNRTESHSVPHTPTGGAFISGHGHVSMGHAQANHASGARVSVGKGTV